MTSELVPCKRCGSKPQICEIQGLYYAQCCGSYRKRVNNKNLTKEEKESKEPRYVTVKCDKWHAYEFMGASKRSAIESWNYANSKRILDEED